MRILMRMRVSDYERFKAHAARLRFTTAEMVQEMLKVREAQQKTGAGA